MKKRISVLMLTLALCLSLGAPALAAGGFSDVAQNAWYLKYLDTAVSSGLINGRGDGRFSPDDDITGAEAVKLAACISQLLSDGSVTLTNGSPWYASYMEYAVEKGILASALDQHALSTPIMRAELMDMVCRAIPEAQRTEINSIPDGSILDVAPSAPYRDNVYALYRMGIVTGSDKRGSCLPEKCISRAEVAALVARVVDRNLRVAFQLEVSDPLDVTDEAGLSEILEGEWSYCPPNSEVPGAYISFSRDGNFHMRVMDPKNNAIWENVGVYQLERWYAMENEAPDILTLTFTDANGSEPASSAGDYMIIERTLCDGEIILSLLQINNGDSMLSTCFDDWAPILRRHTNWKPQGEPRKAEAFCASVWKVDHAARQVWLDDIEPGIRNIGRYEALPYQVAPQLDLHSLPDWLMSGGTIWSVRTDAMGRIVEMIPPTHENEDVLSEEEAAELLSEVYEVQQYLALGMTMLFVGERQNINGETCVLIALGTDHEEYFVRELYYAVAPSGTIYTYDLFTDSWNVV